MPHIYETLNGTISSERLATYLVAAGHNRDRALKLYLWNAQVGESFHVPIQAVEVGLRNSVNRALIAEYGVDWWQEQPLLSTLDEERASDLEQVQRRIRNRNLELGTPQIVAGLSLGFWVGMLKPRYNPTIWGKHLRTAFPNFPAKRGRKSLDEAVSEIATFRNRIWHHEPIFKRDLSKDYSRVTEALGWICPTKAEWIQPHCRVPALLRQKP